MFFWQNQMSQYFLAIIDRLLILLAFSTAYHIKLKYLGPYSGLSAELNYFIILILYLLYANFALGFFKYSEASAIVSWLRELAKVFLIAAFSSIFVIITCYLIHFEQVSRLLLFVHNTLLIIFLICRRGVVSHYLKSNRSNGNNQVRILVIGSKERARDIVRTIISAEDSNYSIIGCLDIDPLFVGHHVAKGVKVLGDMSQFRTHLQKNVVDEVIFAIPLKQVEDASGHIAFAEKLGVNIRIMPDWQLQKIMFRPETASIAFETFIGIPTLALSSRPKKDLELLAKGFIDYVAAFVSLVLLFPLMLIIALLIRITSAGTVIFSQKRAGLNGRVFNMYKFRTMVANAEELRAELEGENEMDGPVFKIDRDPRITILGRFLRRTSLDELPQLFNVMRGEMSLVGPRPPTPEEVEHYEPWQRRRLSMKPGLTCIWQVSEKRNRVSFNNWMEMDLKYIDNWCLLLDIKLIMRTFVVILLGFGR
jgi:exopolysaccharide biosynthesis polyprenyl glycosylphosphotransferase